MKACLPLCLWLVASLGAMPLDEIQPGRTNGFDLRARLGEPVGSAVGTGAVELAERFAAPAAGIASLTAWYDPQGVVRWARITPKVELSVAAAAALFDLSSPPGLRPGHPFLENGPDGRTEAYPREGVYLFIKEGVVREIWRTPGNPDETALRAAVKVLPDASGPPPAPATGNPPERPRALKPGGAASSERTPPVAPRTAVSPDPLPSPGAAPPAVPGLAGPRGLTVDGVNVEPGEWQGTGGLWFTAPVRAVGFAGRTLVGEVRIRTAAGGPLRAPREAGAHFVDADGVLACRAEDAVNFAEAAWNPFRVLVPYGLLDLPRGVPTRVIVTFMARCDGVVALAEREFDLQRP